MAEHTDLPLQSFVLETNYGGIPVTVCACGAILRRHMSAWKHIDACPAMTEPETEDAT